jgi:two-component system sensor histidine kinase QseC
MTRSIRQFLLFNLLLSLVLITMLTVLGTLLLEHKNMGRNTDAELISTTLFFKTIFSSIPEEKISDMQTQFDKFPQDYNAIALEEWNKKVKLRHHFDLFQFQITDLQGKVLLHSKYAPSKEVFSKGNAGFSNLQNDNQTWRVYTYIDFKTKLRFMVALNHQVRNHLEAQIAEDYMFVALLTSPILAILIWLIVGKGLRTLTRVAHELEHRDPGYLEPFNAESLPMEFKPVVDELNYLFARLKDAFEREKRFAGDAAHELRTPLAAVKTQTQLALRATHDEERRNALLRALVGVDRCTHVIQQLLTLSRMVPEAVLEHPKPYNIVSLIKEVIALMVPTALKKSTEIELFTPKDVIMLTGNVTAIGILARNLIDNAIRYTPDHSLIQVHIIDARDQVMLKVIDNGPGIPADLRARVFERFFRVLGTQSAGSGLGLGIVQQIAGLHQAVVTLGESATGTGLDVTIVFPKIL